jgi:nucleoside 2-deoxyribosyltransferase
MKVYLAAPYPEKEMMNMYAAQLRREGITVTSRWLEEPHAPTTGMGDLTPDQHLEYALQDIQDVRAADILVFFTDPTKTLTRGGRHVEFGIAVERGIPIYVVGGFENIFHYLLNVVHMEDWQQAKHAVLAANWLTTYDR